MNTIFKIYTMKITLEKMPLLNLRYLKLKISVFRCFEWLIFQILQNFHVEVTGDCRDAKPTYTTFAEPDRPIKFIFDKRWNQRNCYLFNNELYISFFFFLRKMIYKLLLFMLHIKEHIIKAMIGEKMVVNEQFIKFQTFDNNTWPF